MLRPLRATAVATLLALGLVSSAFAQTPAQAPAQPTPPVETDPPPPPTPQPPAAKPSTELVLV